MSIVLVYLLLCLGVAIMGRHTVIGPVGIFVVSLVLTPIMVLLFLTLLAPARKRG